MSYFSLSVENYRGETLQLTGNPAYQVTRIDGLNPPAAAINTSAHASFDGSTFNSSHVENRNIVIELVIEGDAEKNRIELYRYFKTKKAVKIHFRNGSRDVYTEGYVETFDVGYYEQKENVQVSIICPRPYFIAEQFTSVSFGAVRPLFEFPFSIETPIPFSELDFDSEINVENTGDVETGIVIRFWAMGEMTNPTLYRTDTGQMIKVLVAMELGDVVEVSTISGEKRVTLISDGVETNALNLLDAASSWITLEPGDNTFQTGADTYPENLACTFEYSNLYEGA